MHQRHNHKRYKLVPICSHHHIHLDHLHQFSQCNQRSTSRSSRIITGRSSNIHMGVFQGSIRINTMLEIKNKINVFFIISFFKILLYVLKCLRPVNLESLLVIHFHSNEDPLLIWLNIQFFLKVFRLLLPIKYKYSFNTALKSMTQCERLCTGFRTF